MAIVKIPINLLLHILSYLWNFVVNPVTDSLLKG